MKKIITEIDINASAEKIWSVLMNFEAYPTWNPFIRNIEGEKQMDKQLTVSIQPPGKKPMVFKPHILQIIKQYELSWLGHLIIPGIFDGQHSFRLKKISENQTQFIHSEIFTGVLSAPIFSMIGTATQEGFEQMNKALKDRSERM